MKNVDRARIEHYLHRAESYLSSMQLLAEDLSSYSAPAALLAVHSAISFTDAVLITHLGKRSIDQDHGSVSAPLRKLCHSLKLADDGVKHLTWLIARKSDFAYGDRPTPVSEVQFATTVAKRFQAWVYRSFPEVARENKTTH